ncbi:hypothetical protein O181_044295 [Austropuccinia psidii MF-1]|uniref:Uncharacterized protein n=1 Tax=Austropuccinia psidii MF-1 TaxID=1389203 RepID=A0A9Q3HK13_9BASI|nr:hypothetical protein [Austropuccinia psidii MF-1]
MTSVKEEQCYGTEVVPAPLGASQGTGGTTLAQSNNTVSHQSEPVTGALLSEEGLALSKPGLTYGGLKDMERWNTLKSVRNELL